jgi:hypothetical protein
MTLTETDTRYDIRSNVDTLYQDGVVGLKGAFSRQWAEDMREDITTAFWEAIQRPGGAGMSRSIRRTFVALSISCPIPG